MSGAEENSREEPLEALAKDAWALRDDEPGRAQALAEEVLTAAGDEAVSRAEALIALSFLAARQSRYDRALGHAFDALRLLEKLSLEALMPRLFNVVAMSYDGLGDRAQALEFHQRELEWAQKLDSEDDLFTAYHDLGVYFAGEGDPARELAYYQKARAYVGSDNSREAFLQLNLSYYYSAKGQLDEAQAYAEGALELARTRGTTRLIRYSLEAIAGILLRRKDYRGALEVYQDILRLSEEMHESPGALFLAIAEIHLAADNSEEAQAELERALILLETDSDKRALTQCHQLLYTLHKQQRAFGSALLHLEKFHAYYEATFNEASEMRVRALDVVHRMDALRQESERLQRQNQELGAHLHELQRLHEQVRELSVRDPLTGLYNRRYLYEQSEVLFNLAERQWQPISVAMIDIDYFKEVNDSYGHMVGDEVLRRIADVLKQTLRAADLIARYGGEEFAVVMSDTELASAVATCERLCYTLSEHDWSDVRVGLKLTVSIGIVSAVGGAVGETLFSLADEQLYLAKRSGRNRVYSRSLPAPTRSR